MFKSISFVLVILITLIACTPKSSRQPYTENKETTPPIDSSFLKELNHTSTVKEVTIPQTDYSEDTPQTNKNSGTVNLEIKENISLDKSLTFYNYLPTSKSGYKSDKVFYFLLEANTLTLQQYDKNMAITLQCDFKVIEPWTRTLTLEFNILKTVLNSSMNKNTNFEIGLKNNKVFYVKLGENKFYANTPTTPSVTSTNSKNILGNTTHIVKSGENLKLLAESYCTEVSCLLNINPKIKDRTNYVIYPGETIKIK